MESYLPTGTWPYRGRMGTLTVEEVQDRLSAHVGTEVPGLTWLVRTGDEVISGALGTRRTDGQEALHVEEIFRISSMTKPITAVATLILVGEGRFALDDPIHTWLPELADRQVLRTPGAALTDTVPAERAPTVRDLLSNTLGWGMDFSHPEATPFTRRWAELGLGAGPPAPAEHLPAQEWLDRASTLPLQHQPGQRWLYNTSSVVLGLLLERAAGVTLEQLLSDRLFTPLGMTDTGFWVPEDKRHRFGPCYAEGTEVYDPTDGQWSAPPPLAGGDAGLVATVSDYARFAKLLQGRGSFEGQRLLPADLAHAMVTNRLSEAQLRRGDPGPGSGWGFGVGVLLEGSSRGPSAGSYGWSGGLGSTWTSDPSACRTGVLLTNRMWTDPVPPSVVRTFEELLGHR